MRKTEMKFKKTYVVLALIVAIICTIIGLPFGSQYEPQFSVLTFFGKPIFNWSTSGGSVMGVAEPTWFLAAFLNFMAILVVLGILMLVT
jgi:hypothetical protein